MESLIGALAKHLGDGWLLAVVAIIFAVANSGLVPWLFGERRRAAEERDRLIEHYAKEADNARRWRAEDGQRYEARIAALDERIEKLIEASVLSERGNSRLRHALNNVMQIVVGQCDLAMRRGERPLIQIDGLRNMFGISDDLDEKLRSLFNDAGIDPPSSATC